MYHDKYVPKRDYSVKVKKLSKCTFLTSFNLGMQLEASIFVHALGVSYVNI